MYKISAGQPHMINVHCMNLFSRQEEVRIAFFTAFFVAPASDADTQQKAADRFSQICNVPSESRSLWHALKHLPHQLIHSRKLLVGFHKYVM